MTNLFDVLTFGETMMRLTPPNHQQISQSQSVGLHVGGSESNVAVGLAHLGIQAAWMSALPDNPLGHYVERAIATHRVDTSHVQWPAMGRLGMYWVEVGAAPRSTKVIYDREHTAISQMQPDDLPDDLFDQSKLGWLHLSGITPALSTTAAATTHALMQMAKQAGWRISFDINYRAKLWDTATAKAGCHPFLQDAALIFAPLRDVQNVFGLTGSPDDVFQQFHETYPNATLVMTLGSQGSMAAKPAGEPVQESAFIAQTVDRVGAGDAFVAGFLSQVVGQGNDLDLSYALRWANACAALKHTLVGDMPILNQDDVLALLDDSPTSSIQR